MSKREHSVSHKAGLPPGSLVYVGMNKSTSSQLTVIDYNNDEYRKIDCKSPEETFPFRDTNTVSWINMNGIGDTKTLSAIATYFGLHPLLQEDLLNTSHTPKLEEYDEHLFLTFKLLSIDKKSNTIESEQISLVFGKTWVLSFQETENDEFDVLRDRIEQKKGLIREKNSDYLVYRIIDTVVDNYFLISDHLSDELEELEEEVLEDPNMQLLQRIQYFKRELIQLRKIMSPLREAISMLQKDSGKFIEHETTRYLRDVYEHIIHVTESIETHRDVLGGIMDLYLSGVSNKMNKVMQQLTIVATIFIPLTFLAGIYGMNFQYMPELGWKFGYAGFWGIIFVLLVIMTIYFKRKGWF
ncbi:MAG TPA: magnesium and cobalt transport protein CorA [Flavobacteriales bacterium]|nr:magnesium and cobalt transport protein CorA [Flavobacteriales bacterium]